jgi:large subunit ribosomal protein L17
MLHKVSGRKLGRTKNERTALFRGLANQLILNERITTTEAKAKAVRPMVEKLITKAKTNSIHTRRLLLKELTSENTVAKMLEVVGPKFKDRPGGYTRLVKMGPRTGDRAPMVALMFVDAPSDVKITKAKSKVEEVAVVDPTALEVKEDKEEIKPAPATKKPRARVAKKETNGAE